MKNFLNNGKSSADDSSILREHRTIVESFIQTCINIENPKEFSFHQAPYPIFKWKKVESLEENSSMIISCLSFLVGTLNSVDFSTLLSALLTEYQIIIYGKNIQIVSSIVLALHYLLSPLKWSFPSVSILPKDQYDYLDSPTPFIYGVDQKINMQQFESSIILVNTENKTVELNKKPFPFPADQMEIFENLWDNYQAKQTDLSLLILYHIRNFITDLLTPIPKFIFADVSTSNPVFEFQKEPYLLNFPHEQRSFLDSFVGTQMMSVYIQDECEKQFKVFNKSKE